MMKLESDGAAASVAMRAAANQLEFALFSSQGPGLVAGELTHICKP